MNSKIEFSVYVNINFNQEKFGTEHKNCIRTKMGSATYLLYKSPEIIFTIYYKMKIIITKATTNKNQLHTKYDKQYMHNAHTHTHTHTPTHTHTHKYKASLSYDKPDEPPKLYL